MQRKKKTPKEIKRIYFIVPDTVQVKIPRRKYLKTVRMEAGRLAMQSVHVALRMYEDVLRNFPRAYGYDDITAIQLSVRNSRELAMIEDALRQHAKSFGIPPYEVYSYSDKNADLYGIKGRVQTAICTTPIEKSVVEPVLGHLDTYKDPVEIFLSALRR